nr:ribonuclease H-like domain-containing protein [Tanacetum cinerariifolium]
MIFKFNIILGFSNPLPSRSVMQIKPCCPSISSVCCPRLLCEPSGIGTFLNDFLTRRVLLRCDRTGYLYPVTKSSIIPHAFLTRVLYDGFSRTPVDTESKLGFDGDLVFDLTLYMSLAGALFLAFKRIFKYVRDGTLSRYKACLVANGSTHIEGVDVDETFSPVVKPGTIRTVLSFAISRHWPVHQLDVKNAFFHGDSSETVYMHQPLWFRDSAHHDYVCYLQSLFMVLSRPFGLGFNILLLILLGLGLVLVVVTCHYLFIGWGTDTAYLLLYIDDIVLTASFEILLQRLITSLHQEFFMTDLGALFLAFKRIFKYVRGTLDYGIQLFSSSTTSLEPYFLAFKRIFKYVRGTLDYGIQLFSSSTTSLVAYSNANWAGCPTTWRFIFGYGVFLGNDLLSWSSKRQPTLSRSSAEAEYHGVANVVAETCWLWNLLRELHKPLSSVTLVYYDKVCAVYLSSNPVEHQRTKHIEIDIHFVRDLVVASQVRVLHVP